MAWLQTDRQESGKGEPRSERASHVPLGISGTGCWAARAQQRPRTAILDVFQVCHLNQRGGSGRRAVRIGGDKLCGREPLQSECGRGVRGAATRMCCLTTRPTHTSTPQRLSRHAPPSPSFLQGWSLPPPQMPQSVIASEPAWHTSPRKRWTRWLDRRCGTAGWLAAGCALLLIPQLALAAGTPAQRNTTRRGSVGRAWPGRSQDADPLVGFV